MQTQQTAQATLTQQQTRDLISFKIAARAMRVDEFQSSPGAQAGCDSA